MFINGEKITPEKLKSILQHIYKQINAIDHTQIQALTCGQIIGVDSSGNEQYEFLSTCIDQFYAYNYVTVAKGVLGESFVHKYVKEVNDLRSK